MDGSPAVGIDFGTRYSSVAVYENGEIEFVENEFGKRSQPSFLSFSSFDRLHSIGNEAQTQLKTNPKNVVFDLKQIIGRKFKDLKIQYLPFEVSKVDESININVEYRNEAKIFPVQELISMILLKMKNNAEKQLAANNVHNVVISVPSFYNKNQRQLIIDSAKIAELNVVGLINDSTAISLSYLHKRRINERKLILVLDLGASTFEVSVVVVSDCFVDVKATSGGTHLGGNDFDQRLVDHFIREINAKYNVDLTTNCAAFQRLIAYCEEAKRKLSSITHFDFEIGSLFDGIDFKSTLTRLQFEDNCDDLFHLITYYVDQVLNDANVVKEAIDDIIVVGGATKMPKFKETLRNYFNGRKLNLALLENESVSCGAAIYASILTANDKFRKPIISQVIPTSLGIETEGGIMAKIVERNSKIPFKYSKIFSTVADNQSRMKVKVFESESIATKHNNLLWTFTFSGISSASKGVPQIEVIIDIDESGLFNISAVERLEQNKDESNSNFEITRMKEESKQLHEEEEREYLRVEERNDFEERLFDFKRRLLSNTSIDEEAKTSIKEELIKMFEWLDLNPFATLSELRSKKSNLTLIESCFTT